MKVLIQCVTCPLIFFGIYHGRVVMDVVVVVGWRRRRKI
jgi:hypothetical protein